MQNTLPNNLKPGDIIIQHLIDDKSHKKVIHIIYEISSYVGDALKNTKADKRYTAFSLTDKTSTYLYSNLEYAHSTNTSMKFYFKVLRQDDLENQ